LGQLRAAGGHVVHGETVPGGDVVEQQQSDQHEHRAAEGVQHEVQCRAVTIGSPKTVDEEEQRDQRQFPENIEQRPVARGKDDQHRGFEAQDQREVELRASAHRGRGEDCDEAQDGRQQQHRQRNSVDTERQARAKARVPGTGLEELHLGAGRIKTQQQESGAKHGQRGDDARHMAQELDLATRQQQ